MTGPVTQPQRTGAPAGNGGSASAFSASVAGAKACAAPAKTASAPANPPKTHPLKPNPPAAQNSNAPPPSAPNPQPKPAKASATNPATRSGNATLLAAESDLKNRLKSAGPEQRTEIRSALRDVREARADPCADAHPNPAPQVPPAPSPQQSPVGGHPLPQGDQNPPPRPGWHPPLAPLGGNPPTGQPPVYGPPLPPIAQPPGGWHPPTVPPGPGGGTTQPGSSGAGGNAFASASPSRFDAANDPIVDTAKWAKELLFGARAFGRLPVEGWNGQGGMVARATEKISNLKLQFTQQWGLTVPGYPAPGAQPPVKIIVPGQAGPPAGPIVIPGQTTPSGKPLVLPGQAGAPTGPIVIPGQSAPSGKPIILPGQGTASGQPIVIPGQTTPSGKPLVQPQIAAAEGQLKFWNTSWANATKYIGLGGFSFAANIQKGREIYGYWNSGDAGDKWRAGASSSEFLNNIRLGITGFTPLFRPEGMLANTKIFDAASKYAGGTVGTRFGVGANLVAGGFKLAGVVTDYNKDIHSATTPYQQNGVLYNSWEKALGIGVDTGNDIFPYLSKAEPLAWSTWLTGKLADHGAQAMLHGSGYQPVSFGQEKARNLMPLITGANDLLGAAGVNNGLGLSFVPQTQPLRDMSQPMTPDQALVARYDNSINKAAGIGSGATEVVVTTAEFAAVAYLTRGKNTADVMYGVMNLDHAARQGINVWTDMYWQRPAERQAAVAAAGLDPKLDTRMVVHEQKDFLHRIWAETSANFTAGYIDGKEDFGAATANQRRWLELDKKYTADNVSTDSPRTSDAWYVQALSPETFGTVLKWTNPVLMAMPDSRDVGTASAYVEQGWNSTKGAVSSAWNWAWGK